MKLATISTEAEQFVKLLEDGFKSFQMAGDLIAKAMETNPDFIEEVCAINQNLTEAFVQKFHLIGLRKLHPNCVICERGGIPALRKLPYEMQEKYTTGHKLELVISTNSGTDILNVDVRDLQPNQVLQVFDRDGIRTPASQRAWMESQKAKKSVIPVDTQDIYRVSGKRVTILKPCILSSRQLAMMIAELEGK